MQSDPHIFPPIYLQETEYVQGLDILYIVGNFHIFPSFKKHGAPVRVRLPFQSEAPTPERGNHTSEWASYCSPIYLQETEYIQGLDILYIVENFHIFSSFKKHGAHFRAILPHQSEVPTHQSE